MPRQSPLPDRWDLARPCEHLGGACRAGRARGAGLERRLAKDGVDAVGAHDGVRIDAGMRRQDGPVPCRPIATRPHP